MTDQKFKRDGSNVFTSVSISFIDAINGVKLELKTLTRTIMLNIPAGTQPNTRMRLKNQGLTIGSDTGDLFVDIIVVIPENISENQKKLLDQWNK